jgi:hypothetical protein
VVGWGDGSCVEEGVKIKINKLHYFNLNVIFSCTMQDLGGNVG